MKSGIKQILIVLCVSLAVALLAAAFAQDDEANATEKTYEIWNIWGENMAVEAGASEYDFTGATDDAEFLPHLTAYLVDDQTAAKGNIIVLSGGGDRMRSNPGEGIPCCEWLNSIGYNAYLLDYRVQPYESVDATLDLQRAVRYVKFYAEEKGIGAINCLGTMGFSAGAMHVYAQSIMLSGSIAPDSIYPDYVCDEVDEVDATVETAICIYAAGSAHDTAGDAVDIADPVLILSEDDPNFPKTWPSFFFAGASGHFASGFCVTAYLTLNPITECELHMYGGIDGPFAMGYNYAGSDQMIDQLETFMDVQFGYRDRSNKEK